MKQKMRMRRILSLVSAFMICLTMCLVFTSTAYASQPGTNNITELKDYTSNVKTNMDKDKHYSATGGGYLNIDELFTTENNILVINESNYSKLTSEGKTEFISDINKAATNLVETDSTGKYTEETQTNWYKILQQQDGVGTKFMNVILENTKPDFVAANKIFKNLNDPLGLVLGLGAIGIMSAIGIVMLADICYITIPPIRLFVTDDDGGTGRFSKIKSKIFTHDALYAVEKVENDTSGGTPKQALGIYLKRRIFALILLGICLMYLVQGEIYGLVGKFLDLLAGFI